MKESKWSVTLFRAVSLLLLIGTLSNHSLAAPGDVDPSFDPGSGVDGTVYAVAVQPNGKIIIGGYFRTVPGLVRHNVARLNADGTGDRSFDPGPVLRAAGTALSVAVQADGRILVGGHFEENISSIIRFNSDGTLDTNFNVTIEGWDFRAVHAVVLLSDGKILIGGHFVDVNGTNRDGGLARLNTNGTLDSSFNPDIPHFGIVHTVVPLADGKILVGGTIPIARLNADGTRDTNFNMRPTGFGVPLNGRVYSMAVQADGKILVAGDFSVVDDTPRSRVARLHANGSIDLTFDTGGEITNSAAYTQVNAVALQSDGKVLIGGEFDRINGVARRGLARLNTNGTVDTTIEANTGPDTIFNSVRAITQQPDGKALVGGSFATIKSVVRSKIGRVNPDGTVDGAFDPGSGVDPEVFAVARQPDGKYIIGGLFATVRGLARRGIARLNADGSGDGSFTPDPAMGGATCIAVQPDGKIIIGGGFANLGRVARLNPSGTLDAGFQPSLNARVSALALQADGKILIGGLFGLARLNSDGTTDPSFSSALASDKITLAILPQPDGKVLVGGYSRYYDSDGYYEAYFLLRLNSNGSTDSSFQAAGSVFWSETRQVTTIALQPDSKILVGGIFDGVIFRLHTNGTLDTNFTSAAVGAVSSIALQPDGKILISGNVGPSGGPTGRLIARLNANGSWDFSFNAYTPSDAYGYAHSMVLQAEGKVVIGGMFMTVNGVLRPHLALLFGNSAAPSLSILRSNNFGILSWPVTALSFQLQENTNLSLANGWSVVAAPRSTNNSFISVALPASDHRKFFRLSLP